MSDLVRNLRNLFKAGRHERQPVSRTSCGCNIYEGEDPRPCWALDDGYVWSLYA